MLVPITKQKLSKYQCPICKEKYLLYQEEELPIDFDKERHVVLRGIELKSKEYTDAFDKTTYHCHSCSNDFTITKLNYVDDNGNVIVNNNPYFELHFNDENK